LPGAAPPLDTAGLSSAEAARRLAEFGRNELRDRRQNSRLRVLWNQLRSPLLLLLLFAAGNTLLPAIMSTSAYSAPGRPTAHG
jgi:magnesium-transporting ATPase (P-type)